MRRNWGLGAHIRARRAAKKIGPPKEPTPWILVIVLGFMIFMMLFGRMIHAEDMPAMPRYCRVFKLLDRSCGSVYLYVKMFGAEKAEARARACGASDSDIQAATSCLKK